MRFLPALLQSLVLAGAISAPALAQTGATVTVTLENIYESKGTIRAQLCADAKALAMGVCSYPVTAAAKAGSVDLVFRNVPDGTYAFEAYDDANDDGRLGIPTEGYAYGNNQSYPADFNKAAMKVAGDTRATVKLIYMSDPRTAGQGEQGVKPRDGIIKTDLRDKGLYGAFYSPAGAKNLPTIIAIGGSEGGLDTISGISNSFASHGYNVLALAYWRAPGLPQTLEGVPLEYFDAAIDWLKARPEVDGQHIGMMGWSRGGEGVLLIGSHTKELKAIMALSPGAHVMSGLNLGAPTKSKAAWTLKGQAIPYYIPNMSGQATGASMREIMHDALKSALAHPETEIPVETINGPILLLTGSADGIWNSPANAELVIARLKAHKFRFDAQHIDYPGGSHLVFMGDPQSQQNYAGFETMRGIMGGTLQDDQAAWASSWPTTLAFFDKALKGKRP